jgi:hypothetical protein
MNVNACLDKKTPQSLERGVFVGKESTKQAFRGKQTSYLSSKSLKVAPKIAPYKLSISIVLFY